jgi:hypothetical protein
MEHLNVIFLASTSILFRTTTMLMPNFAVIETNGLQYIYRKRTIDLMLYVDMFTQ